MKDKQFILIHVSSSISTDDLIDIETHLQNNINKNIKRLHNLIPICFIYLK